MAGAHTAPRPARDPDPDRAPAGRRAPDGHRSRRRRRIEPRLASLTLAVLVGIALLSLVLTTGGGSGSPRNQADLVPAGLPTHTVAPPPAATAAPTPTGTHPVAKATRAAAAAPKAIPAPTHPAPAPTAAAAAAIADPFAGEHLYLDPTTAAVNAMRSLQSSQPATAQTLAKIAFTPQADWIGDGSPSAVTSQVAAQVAAARASGSLPLFVAYDIPDRDCGSYSAGGASADTYSAWIDGFAAGLGHGEAAVVVEPDALAQITCLPADGQAQRYGLLKHAVQALSATGASVYLDAGNPGWISPSDMANRLKQAGVTGARGFAVNVSNFATTPADLAYGDAVVAALGGSGHFVVDTSRNGRGAAPGNQWCNPAGRGLGSAPTASTGDPRADALLWIKRPGESDGTCNGGPAAGQWWTDYAVGLVSRAA